MYYGQFKTDYIIESYFPNKKDGYCIEVGAYDGIKGSNTKYFEDLGWTCLCFEPNENIFNKLILNRKCQCSNWALSNQSGWAGLTVFQLRSGIESSLTSLEPDDRLIKDYGQDIINKEKLEVRTITLTEALIKTGFNACPIDFISIDTEGTELQVLKGLDLSYFRPYLLVVENNYEDSNIEIYLEQFNYIKDQRYYINDFYIRN